MRSSSLRGSLQSKIDLAQMPPVYKIPLYQLNFFGFGEVKKKDPSTNILLKEAVAYQREKQKGDVTLVFAIRQVG